MMLDETERVVTVYVSALPAADPEAAERKLRPVLDFLPPDQRRAILANRRPVDRALRLLARALLALGLNQEEGLDPRSVLGRFRVDEKGRPGCGAAVLSLSHCVPYGVCALARPGWTEGLGVDVEAVRPLEADDFGNVFSGGELEAIKLAENRDGELIRRWTVKEAALKARGLGFSGDPRPICSDRGAEGLAVGGLVWRHLDLEPGFRLTVSAVSDGAFEARLRRLEIGDYLRLFGPEGEIV